MSRIVGGNNIWVWICFLVGLPFAIVGWILHTIKEFFSRVDVEHNN
jgi:hypothetical protein